MIEKAKILIECCKYLGLTKEEAELVLKILHTEEQRSYMICWMRENIERNPQSIDVILAACEIHEDHKCKDCCNSD